jgi:hypothetical protein
MLGKITLCECSHNGKLKKPVSARILSFDHLEILSDWRNYVTDARANDE